MLALLIGFLTLSVSTTLSISLRHSQLLLGNPLASSHGMSPSDLLSSSEVVDLPESPPLPDDALISFRRRRLLKKIANRVGGLPPCQRRCLNSLYDRVGSVLPTQSYADKYHKTCSAYKHARKCAKKQQKLCNENGKMFAMATSGIHYMCIEQSKAFKANLECIERNAFMIHAYCDAQCETAESPTNVITMFMYLHNSGLTDSTDMDEALQQDMFDSKRGFEEITSSACMQAECALMCLKGKYDLICENSTGMLLSEAIVRPLALSQRMFPHEFRALGMMLPESCKFLSSGLRMIRHRMDPGINAELLEHFGTTNEEKNHEDKKFVEEKSDNDTPIYADAYTEESGTSTYPSKASNNSVVEGSNRIVFKAPLTTTPTYTVFTANATGILHCGVVQRQGTTTGTYS